MGECPTVLGAQRPGWPAAHTGKTWWTTPGIRFSILRALESKSLKGLSRWVIGSCFYSETIFMGEIVANMK